MNEANARNLSNDFQDVQLYSLHTWPDAPKFRGPDGRGPFVVLQTAIDPEDRLAAVTEFILGRSGHWLPLGLFQQLPEDARREEYLFPGAAAVIAVLQGLGSKPIVERGASAEPAAAPDASDPLNAAIAAARQGDPAP